MIDVEMKIIALLGSDVEFGYPRLFINKNAQILNTRGYNQKSTEFILNIT